MKKILIILIGILVIAAISVTVLQVGAAETTCFETEVHKVEIGSNEAKEVVDVLENSPTKAEAILLIAERLGISAEDAEQLIDAVLEFGDAYFGEDQWWIAFKNNVEEDLQYWTTALVVAIAVISIGAGASVLIVKFNPVLKKTMYGMAETVKICKESSESNSQTLGNIELLVKETIDKDELFMKLLDEKESENTKLLERISALEASNERERRDMLMAEVYNLRMLKLICDRTALPLADKATIDLFYAKGIDSIKAELSESDVETIEKTTALLEGVNSKKNE